MNCQSTLKTLIFCQLSDNLSLQDYTSLTFPSLVDLPHNELHYSPSHVGPPHCEKPSSELLESCQQWELTFLLTIASTATKILSTVGVDIPIDCSFQRYQNPENFKS